MWARDIMEMVLSRVQENTRALSSLAERIDAREDDR
jgi:hypothetical protein